LPNQNTTYFHTTFKATITKEQLLKDKEELGQWQYVAKKYNVSHAYIIMMRKDLGIFDKTITKGRAYGGLNSHATKNRGKRTDKRGYVIIGRYHPDNTKERSMYEHTWVMEQYLKRSLNPGESIHHIDGNKSNNDINNLYLCDNSKHRQAEYSLQRLIPNLLQKGVISFDKEQGIYKENL
jgi:HNH endonuclease